MSSEKTAPKKREQTIVKSNDFRHIPADSIGVTVSNHGVKLMFSVEEDDNKFLELVSVHVSHTTAALLRNVLIEGIKYYEKHENRDVFPSIEASIESD